MATFVLIDCNCESEILKRGETSSTPRDFVAVVVVEVDEDRLVAAFIDAILRSSSWVVNRKIIRICLYRKDHVPFSVYSFECGRLLV